MKLLIVVDMQNDFVDGVLGTPEAQAIVPNIIKKLNGCEEDTVVLFTKDTHQKTYLNTQEGKNLPVEHCIENTDGWCINKAIRKAWHNNEYLLRMDSAFGHIKVVNSVVKKDTFASLDLAEILCSYEADIEYIELTGVCLDICVIANAILLKTRMPEIKISINTKCTAATSKEAFEATKILMKSLQIGDSSE